MEHAPTFTKWFRPERVQLPELNSKEPDELIYDLPFAQYLGDRTCVSNSGLRKMLKSPRHYIADLLGYEDEDEDSEKDHFRFGRAAHMMILEPARFSQLHVVMPEFVGMTKDGKPSTQSADARAQKKQWLAEQDPEAMIITQVEMDHLLNMVDSLMSHETASGLLKNGRPEVTGRFIHKPTGIRVRIRPDYFTFDDQERLYISDLKTSRNVSRGLFSKDAAEKGYYMQLALYVDGVAQITGRQVEAAALIALEKTPPYSTALYWLNDDDLAEGRRLYERALQRLKECFETKRWDDIQGGRGEMLSMPAFIKYDDYQPR